MLTPVHFTPPWLKAEGKKKLPTFDLRPGDVLEREAFEAELEGKYRAAPVPRFQLRDAALAGIAALMPGEAGDALREIVLAEYDDPQALSTEDRAKAGAVAEILAEHWPDYAALVARNARNRALTPTLAFMRFCVGWEHVSDEDGEPVAYERNAIDEIPDEVLRRIPSWFIRAAGTEAYGLLYGRTQAKN